MARKLKQGEVVHYRVTEMDAREINFWRNNPGGIQGNVQIAKGNPLVAGERVPLMVVKVSGDRINGQALLDGNDSVWVKSATEGDEPGQWSWGDKDDED